MARRGWARTDDRVRGSRAFRLLLTVLLLCGPVALPGVAAADAAAPKHVLVLGDSLVGGSSNYIKYHLTYDGKVGGPTPAPTQRSPLTTEVSHVFGRF